MNGRFYEKWRGTSPPQMDLGFTRNSLRYLQGRYLFCVLRQISHGLEKCEGRIPFFCIISISQFPGGISDRLVKQIAHAEENIRVHQKK